MSALALAVGTGSGVEEGAAESEEGWAPGPGSEPPVVVGEDSGKPEGRCGAGEDGAGAPTAGVPAEPLGE